MITGKRSNRAILWTGVGLGILTFVWLFPGLDDVGITWDEPLYFDSIRLIQDWAEQVVSGPDRASAMTRQAVRETFDWGRYWNPHPPAYKLAMAATEALFDRWTGEFVGYRIAPLALFSVLVAGVTWLSGMTWGWPAALAAGLSMLLMPRVAGHAHIGATDVPLTLAWFVACVGLVLYVVKEQRRYLLVGAIGLGFALATKFTGYLIPLAMLLWVLVYGRSRHAISGAILWGLVGLVVAWAVNPLMWHDPVAETLQLVRESMAREEVIPITTYYLGRVWGYQVPGHHLIVMTLITVPLSILVLAGWGTAATVRRLSEEPLIGLCLTQILFFVALMAAPSSPNHDGVRLWLPMFPFLAMLSGRGFASVLAVVRRRLSARPSLLASLAIGALFFLPPYLQMERVAPFYLSYYNELIGGVRGGARAGMEATYWLDAVTPSFLERLNEYLPEGAALYAYPNWTHFRWLQENGMLREDLVVTRELPADYLVLLARKASFKPYHRRLYESVRPVLAVELDGVELVGLYAWESAEEVEPDPEDP